MKSLLNDLMTQTCCIGYKIEMQQLSQFSFHNNINNIMARKKSNNIANIEQRESVQTQTTISDFMHDRYRKYALYTVFDRAIPDARDGFKPTARKIIYVALKRLKEGQIRKISALAGYVQAESKYEHGPISLEGNIVTLAQEFKQSIPYLAPEGQLGTFYSPYAGASRYVGVKLSNAFELLMKDNDLLERQWQEGEEIEPKCYLPIVPTVLLNVIQGIAVGFASNINNRNPIEVCDAVLACLRGEDIYDIKLTPYAKGLQGEWRLVNGVYEHHGRMDVINDTTVEVTAIPYNNTFDGYENHLNSLIECDFIKSWTNYSKKQNIRYELHFDKHVLAKAIEDDSLYWRLQMFCRIPTDNLTVIDFDDKVRRYDTVGQLITNFVNWRLKFYDIRKQHQIANIEQEIAKCIDISKFIDLILNDVIVLHKQSSKDVKQILTDNNISHEVLKIAVSRLTKDEQKKLADTIKTLKRSKKEIEQSNIVDTYYAEVESLKQTLLDNGYELPEVRHVTI